jgi:hypothetical protein
MSIKCAECGKTKPTKLFCGKNNVVQFDNCRECRMTPHAEKVSRAEVVKASSISKMAGFYKPQPWSVRAGSDAFLRVPSRRFT